MSEKEKICCFTGEREVPQEETEALVKALSYEVEGMILHGYTQFRTGCTPGFETLAAKIILIFRELYPHIRLRLYLSSVGEEKEWSEKERQEYNEILNKSNYFMFSGEDNATEIGKKWDWALGGEKEARICYYKKEEKKLDEIKKFCQMKNIPAINLANKIAR